MSGSGPIYNSRIYKVFLEYIEKKYPHANLENILAHAGMKKYDVENPSQWYTQEHSDRFYEAAVWETGVTTLPRDAGRYTAVSTGMSTLNRVAMSLLNPHSIYMLMARLGPRMSRASSLSAKKLTAQSIEITAHPKPEHPERPYQCENRIGTLESIPRLFHLPMAKVIHNECIHSGGNCCRYEVSWERAPHESWKRLARILTILAPIIVGLSLSFLFYGVALHISLLYLLTVVTVYFVSHMKEKSHLVQIIHDQGKVSEDLDIEMKHRRQTGLLIHSIGQASVTSLHIDSLMQNIAAAMESHLELARCAIFCRLPGKNHFANVASYGHGFAAVPNELFEQLVETKEPIYCTDLQAIAEKTPGSVYQYFSSLNTETLICAPIVYDGDTLAFVLTYSAAREIKLGFREMNAVLAVVSQIAVGISNTQSFQRLEDSERKYRQLIESAESIILSLDQNGSVLFCNSYGQKLLGFLLEEMVDQSLDRVFSIDKQAARMLRECVDQSHSFPENTTSCEGEIDFGDRRKLWVAWTIKPILTENRKIEEVLCIGNDITARKNSENERHLLETQLQQARKLEAIGTLAGGIAHDFNNLLMGIQGCSQIMLNEEQSNPEHTGLLHEIEDYVAGASNLTKQLLAFARSGKYEVLSIDLNEIVKRTATMFGRTKKELRIDVNLDAELWNVRADTSQIEQVILNLCINSWHAMPSGGMLTLKTKNQTFLGNNPPPQQLQPGRYVVLSITDTGVGMDAETQERIFEPFFTTRMMGHGAGLGLASVYGIVQNHSGHITVTSAPGQGSTFEIFLPATDKMPKKEPVKIQAPEQGQGTLLLVDDEQMVLRVAKRMLEKLGYRVLVAGGGEEAVARYQEDQPIDAVVLDMIMPDLGGAETFEKLKSLDPEVKVLLASGYAVDNQAQKILDMGCDGFIQKPFDLGTLSTRLRELLEK